MIKVNFPDKSFVHPKDFVDGHAYYVTTVNEILIANNYDNVLAFGLSGKIVMNRRYEDYTAEEVRRTWGNIYEVDIEVNVIT